MLLKQIESENELLYSNIQGESIPFTIGDSSVIIDIIRKKIYSYPIRTMVQEYLSNAKDSCFEAGKSSSCIQVSLPTNLKPEFSIRDYGVGMSDERIREVFVQYGISTKRQSISQLGYFGIGSKSGWAYTDSFIVESFYEGTHRQYVADIGDNKEGRLLLYSEKVTDQENGVLIKIPVALTDIQEFLDSFIRATCFWKDKPQILGSSVSYPTDVVKINESVVIYKFDRRYSDTRNRLNPTVYFNANGIPFEAQGLYDKNITSLHNLFNFCTNAPTSNEPLMISIKVDPAKLGISANRESFSNQKYAYNKLIEAHDNIIDYVYKQFTTNNFSQYTKIHKSLGILTYFNHGFFNDKEYIIGNRWHDVLLNLKKGYLSRIEYGIKYHKSIVRSISLYDAHKSIEMKVFLSRSKGIVVVPKKGQIKTPEFESSTKKALILAKQQRLLEISKMKNLSNTTQMYVLFQEHLTDEEYQELGAVIGATQYIEDYFKNVAPIKFQQPDKQPQKDNKLTVRKFEQGLKRDSKAIRSRVYLTIDDAYIANYDGIFYGENCSLAFCRLLNNSKFNFCAVYGSPSTLKKLDDLKNPKIVPIESFSDFIKNTPHILQSFIDHWVVHNNKPAIEFLCNVKTALESQKFNTTALLNRAASFLDRAVNVNPQGFIQNVEWKSEILDFLNTYPLLTKMKDYPPFPRNLYSHITFYMKSIDGGYIT